MDSLMCLNVYQNFTPVVAGLLVDGLDPTAAHGAVVSRLPYRRQTQERTTLTMKFVLLR